MYVVQGRTKLTHDVLFNVGTTTVLPGTNGALHRMPPLVPGLYTWVHGATARRASAGQYSVEARRCQTRTSKARTRRRVAGAKVSVPALELWGSPVSS